jgi:autotransporter-associated beta strand protein
MNTNTSLAPWCKSATAAPCARQIPPLVALLLALLVAALSPQPANAVTYYFDNDSSNPGFGTAGGLWAAPTPGPIPGWTTSTTGITVPGSITTLTTDVLNFGNGATGLGAGTITLSGALNSGNIIFAAGSGGIVLTGGTSLTLAAAATITVNNSSDTIATPLAGAGTSLTKAGTGTLILSGANTIAGTVTLTGGELQLNGGSFDLGAKAVSVATGSGQTAVLNLINGSITNSVTDNIGSGTNNAVGVFKLSGGNYVKTAGNLNLSGGAAGRTNYGAFLMSGGFASVGTEVDMARDSLSAATYVNISGGLFVCSNFATVGREGLGTLDISGGTFFRPPTAINKFYMNRSVGSFSELTLRGSGTLDIEDNAGFPFVNSSANGGSGVANLLPGGTLISRVGLSLVSGSSLVYGFLNFNGGTLKASGSSATFWTSLWTACYVHSGGATIDSQANNITIAQPLIAPTGNGVTSITGGTGSGYLAPPVVSITGDGRGATAIAQLDSNGAITNVLISNPGVDYSSAAVDFVGGGGTASGWTVSLGANANTGGLTKLGAGTLTLNGANTYQGATKIGAGTLAISYANYPSASALTLSNNAALNLDVSGGANTLATPSLTLRTNAVLNISYGTVAGNPFQPAISDVTINAGTVLTANGTNIVINLSGSGFTSGQFPVLKYSGSIGGNGFTAFKLGTLPSGVPSNAQLINNVGNSSIDLFIPVVNTLAWSGTNSNWNINTTFNWRDPFSNPSTYKEYGTTNIYGDVVTFDDTLSDPSKTNINLTTTLRPSSVTVSGASANYAFSGPGKLSGASFLTVNGSAGLAIYTTNDYTGGNALSAGTILAGNNAALGSGPITLAGSVLSSDSAAGRAFSNAVSITTDTAFGTGPTSGALTFSGPVDLGGVGRNLSLDNNVNLTGPVSNGGIVKNGTGKLTVDNTGTSLTAATTVNAGTVALNNGKFTGVFSVAPAIGQSGIIEIGNANVTNTAQNNVAASANTLGVIKQSGGNFVVSGIMAFGNVNANVSAAYLMSGGFASFGGDTRLDNNGSVGLISQSGGTMVSLNFFTIARDGGLGVYDLSGGTHLRPPSATNELYLGTRANGGNAQLTIRGTGTLDIQDSEGLWFNHAGDRTSQLAGNVNILAGGTLISRVGLRWGSLNSSSIGYVNFNGGTLRASGSSSDYWSGWSGAYIFGGGAVIDSQGNSISIGQAFLAPTGSGVTSITGGSGSGYVSPPVVTISGDGSGATAVAQIDSNGNVTGIIVTSPGVDYTSASANFSGGGSAGGYTVNLAANSTTGGLTKLGSGTLTLTCTNNYAGLTTVSNGTLVLGKAQAATGNIAVADGARLGCWSDTPGATVPVRSATLGVTTGAGLLAQFTGNSGNPTAAAGYITNLTLNGTTPVSVTCSGIQVGTITLLQYSNLSGPGGLTLGTLPQGVLGTLTNNTTTKTISLIVTGFAPLVWSGTNSSIWDINISTNWLVSGLPAAYQDGASLVLFNDTAFTGSVIITQAVSPASLVISNSVLAYDVGTSGAGVLSGTTGVTKEGSGTATLSGTNNYTGVTVINNGTLQIGNGGAGGILSTASAITVNASGTLAFNTSTIQNNINNNIAGTGTINKSGAQMGWGGTNTFSGTINVLVGKLAFSGSESENGQPNVSIASGAVVSIGAGFAGGTATLGNLTGAGAIDAAFGANVGIRTLQVNQTVNGEFSGPMAESSAGRQLALIKTGPATLTFSGTNNYSGSTVVSNGTFIVNGWLTSNSIVSVNAGATFGGSGSVLSTVSFQDGTSATNKVGAPLTVSTLDLAGNAAFKVGTASPLSAGDYPLISYTALTGSGTFTNLVVGGAGLASGATASVVFTNSTVALIVVGGAPSPATITYTVNGNQLVLNWPAGQGWQLQAQTNNLNTGLTTNWFTISGAIPPFTNTLSPANPSVFYRLKN